jgi:hypothetical protein
MSPPDEEPTRRSTLRGAATDAEAETDVADADDAAEVDVDDVDVNDTIAAVDATVASAPESEAVLALPSAAADAADTDAASEPLPPLEPAAPAVAADTAGGSSKVDCASSDASAPTPSLDFLSAVADDADDAAAASGAPRTGVRTSRMNIYLDFGIRKWCDADVCYNRINLARVGAVDAIPGDRKKQQKSYGDRASRRAPDCVAA